MLAWIHRLTGRARHDGDTPTPRVIPRDQHPISRRQICKDALKVLYRLKDAGYEAYLVGGCVRDLLLGLEPKDFDVATDARPEDIRALFRNSRIIGRRFRIVHIRFGRNLIEVTTFRGHHESGDEHDARQTDTGMLLRDNVFGSIEEDALRRDFTVNALYYSIRDFAIHDFANGLADLENRQLRLIGDPETRYREDPVRILRAVRFAAKLDFTLAPETAAPIASLRSLLEAVPPARLFDELLKLLMSGYGVTAFEQVERHDLLPHLLPGTADALARDDWVHPFLHQALRNTDDRIAAGKPVTPAFLYAALLWPKVHAGQAAYQAQGDPPMPALRQAAQDVLRQQMQHTSIPKRFSGPMREIWELQLRLPKRTPRSVITLSEHPRFRAAYDFLLLRESTGEIEPGLGDWWTRWQAADEDERQALVATVKPPRRRRRRPRKRRGPGTH